jgi:hypothetical protein
MWCRVSGRFPCLNGGSLLETPARTPFPGVRIVAAIRYPDAATDVSQRIGDAAIDMGWVLKRADQGPEPSGTRFRSSFTRDGRELATSVWPASSGSVLQIMTFGAKGK